VINVVPISAAMAVLMQVYWACLISLRDVKGSFAVFSNKDIRHACHSVLFGHCILYCTVSILIIVYQELHENINPM
jgi:hypothetical protein